MQFQSHREISWWLFQIICILHSFFKILMITYTNPVYQEYNMPGVKHISPQQVQYLTESDNVLLVDVREHEETLLAKPETKSGVVHIPLSDFANHFKELPHEKNLLIMCAHGIRSVQVCAWLMQNGYDKVLNVDGGFEVFKTF
jgi:rhodanese-related sulfurtransferase